MNKEIAIQTIEGLFPLDAEYSKTKSIAEDLLIEAFQNTNFDWRNLPEEVLFEYARLCLERDKVETDKWLKKNL